MAKPGQPSRKMFIRDLMNLTTMNDPTNTSGSKGWLLGNGKGSYKLVKFIWLQGTVLECDNPDTFTLDDGTGVALIGGCSKMPAVCPRAKQGGYFMVIGELKAIEDIPAVKAFKIQDLSDQVKLRSMWPLEVLDMNCS